MLAKIPLTNVFELSSPYFLASSTASFIATLYGTSLYFISYIASSNKLKSIFDILSNFQFDFRFSSIKAFISTLFFSLSIHCENGRQP